MAASTFVRWQNGTYATDAAVEPGTKVEYYPDEVRFYEAETKTFRRINRRYFISQTEYLDD